MSARAARSGTSLRSQLNLAERLFMGAEDRGVLDRIEAGLEQVEAGIVGHVRFADSVADVATRYLLDAGGKRVRPLLVLVTAQLGSGVTPKVVTAAQAVELTHLASLYHDDVMDEAEQRRGVPSAQTVWGNSVAILAGDLLFARASRLIAEADPFTMVSHTQTFEQLVLGQLHETVGPAADEDPIDHYLQVLRDKTGALLAAAAEWGVVFSDADPAYRTPLRTYGEHLGVAFQLADDVIDLSPEPSVTGKVPGTDLRKGVTTLPLLYLRRQAATDPEAAALLTRIEDLVALSRDADADPSALERAVAELRAHEVTAATTLEAARWSDSAIDALRPLPDGSVKRALIRFASEVVDRSN